MTYLLEAFVEKIETPVICIIDEIESRYENGKEAMAAKWKERLKVVSISAKDGQIILKMEHADLMPKINWNGEESVDFF